MKKKEYTFIVWKNRENKDFLADCYINNKRVGLAKGKSKGELFNSVFDLFLKLEKIRISP